MHGPTCICWANLTPFSLEVSGGELKGLKMLRLVRLAKMLRLRKMKELLQRVGDNHGIDLDFLINTGVMLLFIGVALHILACIYYLGPGPPWGKVPYYYSPPYNSSYNSPFK